MIKDVTIVVTWLLLAAFVMIELLMDSNRVLTTFAAWLGGVVSVLLVQQLWRLWQARHA